MLPGWAGAAAVVPDVAGKGPLAFWLDRLQPQSDSATAAATVQVNCAFIGNILLFVLQFTLQSVCDALRNG